MIWIILVIAEDFQFDKTEICAEVVCHVHDASR